MVVTKAEVRSQRPRGRSRSSSVQRSPNDSNHRSGVRYRSSGQTAASHNRVERVLVATLHDEEVPAIRHERFDLGRVVRRVAAGLVELLARCEHYGDSGIEALLVTHSLTLGIRAREDAAERS